MGAGKRIIRGKVAILGDYASGKTSLAQAFATGGSGVPKSHSMTTDADIQVKSVLIPETDAQVDMFIVDLPGHEVYATTTEALAAGASAFVITVDVTSKDALSGIGRWLKLAATIRTSSPLLGCLVATKCDITDSRRVVQAQQAQDVARSLNLEYFECSSKTNTEVESPFFFIANALYETYEEHIASLTTGSS
ncbi:P-loop containing nucleoside triphosphate hydrolase protein [Blastocladiella britannica]|nr:P-loop containing nucleoside triphosphate hydrolase protein [Blastocladiella britannica]